MGGPGGPQGPRPDGKVEVLFSVPANKCGLVIGKGGETIRTINQQTGAHCELDRRPPADPSEKTFIMRGTPEQIEHAKKLIAEKSGISYPGNGNGGGGGGGPPGGPGQNGPNNFAPQGWGNAYQQWNQGPPNDPTKQVADANAAAWAAYYSHCYGSGQPPQGQNASQSNSQGQPPGQPQPGGQQDYSAQWADYYRSLGMIREAEAIEQQSKSMKQGAAPQQQQPPQQSGGQGTDSAQAPSSGTQDYSQQWIDYYRSQGLYAEADKIIEALMKSKKGQPGGGGGGGPAGGAPQSGSVPAGGQNPPGALPQQPSGGAAAAAAPGTSGTQDYSQQWIEYYRSHGMNAEADKIEQTLKASKASGGGAVPAPGAPMYNAYNQGY